MIDLRIKTKQRVASRRPAFSFDIARCYAEHATANEGLNVYDFLARRYDMAIPRFTTPDPLAEKYYSISPYAYCGNNPVNRIDPNGMDWYTDKDGTYQYNPDLNHDNQSKVLREGQSYVGATYQVKNDKGGVVTDYRRDGSIMYANQKDAYTRIISNTEKTGNEEAMVILDNGALVIPNYKNDSSTAEWKPYGYTFDNGNIVDPVSGKTLNTVATAHTHPNGDPSPSTWTFDGYGDLGFAANNTPYKPVYVFAVGKGDVSFIYAAPSATKTGEYFSHNLTAENPKYNMKNLQNGQFNLRKLTNMANFRIALPKIK